MIQKLRNCTLLWLSLLILVFVVPVAAQTASSDGASGSRFVGEWKGTCADGKPFVLLTLRQEEGAITGNVEIANMQGAEGQCESVTDPPSKEHAMAISDAHLTVKVLTFNGPRDTKFEMTTTGANSARLKFLGTPVEDNPWTLERVK